MCVAAILAAAWVAGLGAGDPLGPWIPQQSIAAATVATADVGATAAAVSDAGARSVVTEPRARQGMDGLLWSVDTRPEMADGVLRLTAEQVEALGPTALAEYDVVVHAPWNGEVALIEATWRGAERVGGWRWSMAPLSAGLLAALATGLATALQTRRRRAAGLGAGVGLMVGLRLLGVVVPFGVLSAVLMVHGGLALVHFAMAVQRASTALHGTTPARLPTGTPLPAPVTQRIRR